MDDSVAQKESESLEVKGFGLELTAKGQQLIWLVVVISVVAGAGWFLYQHHLETIEGNAKILDRLDAMVYMLSLPQPERDKLRLTMPDSLRTKLRRRDLETP